MKVRCLHDGLVPISELKLNPNNRNIHPHDQIARLADILKYQGWRYCVKVSKLSGMVSSGHGRVEAALLNGWDTVPVNYQEYDDADQEYADSIADNAISTWSELNFAGIQMDITGLSTDFKVDLLGMKTIDSPKESSEKRIDLSSQWIVSVHCSHEEDMQKVFEEMTSRGFSCKLIT